MNALIDLSEVARNLGLPAIAMLGAAIAYWQTRIGKRRNGFDLLTKAVELYSAADAAKRLGAYALMLEAIENTQSRKMASRMFLSYLQQETDETLLKDCFRLALDTGVKDWVRQRLRSVERQTMKETDVE